MAVGTAVGISASDPKCDFTATMVWKDGLVSRLRSGVYGLLRRAKVKVVTGTGPFAMEKPAWLKSDTGQQVITAEHVVIATGSRAVPLPALPFGGPVVSSSEALSFEPEVRRVVSSDEGRQGHSAAQRAGC